MNNRIPVATMSMSFHATCLRFTVVIALLGILAAELPGLEIVNESGEHLEDGRYISDHGGYSVAVPSLHSKVVRVQGAVADPGITWHANFIGEYGRVATIICTKIREEFPKNDLILQRIAANGKMEALRRGGHLEDMEVITGGGDEGGPQRIMLQCVVRYIQCGQQVLLRDQFLGELVPVNMDVYGIHRYIIRQGFLYEFAWIVPQFGPPEVFDENEVIRRELGEMAVFMKSFQLTNGDDPRLQQALDNYEVKRNYFRFIIPSPGPNDDVGRFTISGGTGEDAPKDQE